MKKSMVYTRTGDDGTTSLIGGVRVPKTHIRLEAYGTVDELNAQIGCLVSQMEEGTDKSLLQFVQHKLFVLGAYLATETSKTDLSPVSQITDENITRLEEAIDTLDASLPPLRGFILPAQHFLHFAKEFVLKPQPLHQFQAHRHLLSSLRLEQWHLINFCRLESFVQTSF